MSKREARASYLASAREEMPASAPVFSAPAVVQVYRQTRRPMAAVFALCVCGVYAINSNQQPQGPALVVDMRADTQSVAQLFYDTGRGMNEADSVAHPVSGSGAYSVLRFRLPNARIRALRFDPLNGAGSFSLRRAYIENSSGQVMQHFELRDFVAANQIAREVQTASEVMFSTAPNANDPMLQIALSHPVDASSSFASEAKVLAVQLMICALITAVVGILYFLAQRRTLVFGPFLDRLAHAISDAEFMVFDRFAIGWYLCVLLLFLVFVGAGFHGSAVSMFSRTNFSAAASGEPILGTPKPIRSDEWAYHTPAILNQVYRDRAFDAQVSSVGPYNAALFANIPVKDLTTAFRPQFWGFFFLPPAYAFAFYWQFKAVLLFTGVFSLLLLLTQSSRIAAFGALWYGFSPFTQWTYSWPSLLPEMVGLLCIVLCAVFYMSVGRRPALLIAAAALAISGAVNFALCAYIPHQIPLVWLGVFLCIWWVTVKWKAIFTPAHALARVGALCGTSLAVGVVMLFFYWDAEPALTVISNTTYPGQRSLPSGTYPLVMLFSHFFSFWEDESRFPLPQVFGNICECAGFLWLAPVTVFCLRGMHRDETYRRRAYWILAVFAAVLLVWLLCPLPAWIGRATFMDKSGVGRSLHVLGLVNIALVALCLSFRKREEAERRLRDRITLATAVFVNVYPVFLLVNISAANFLTPVQVALAAVYTTLVVLALIENRFKFLATIMLLPHIVLFAFVNPLNRGLQAVESVSLFQFIQSSPELLRGRWIVYSDHVQDPGFFTAIGCDVVTGMKYVPDLEALRLFDSTGAYKRILNQSGFLLAQPEYGMERPRFESVHAGVAHWKVNPLTPAFRDLRVRYAAFRSQPPPEIAARMKQLSAGPINEFWLYELPYQVD